METFQDDEYIHYFAFDHGSGVCIYVKTSQIVHFKSFILYQLYLNKV